MKMNKKIIKYGGMVLGGLVILLVIGYFIGTSGWFVKSAVLPRVGKAFNANIKADDISISPFSQVVVKNLSLTTLDNKPIVTVGSFTTRYSLINILRGNIDIKEITIGSPVINLELYEDGTSNIQKLMEASLQKEAPQKETAAPSAPIKLNLDNFSIDNATINFTQKSKTGSMSAVINNLNLKVSGVKNGGTSAITFSTLWNLIIASATNKNELAGNSKANLELAFNPELFPQSGKGGAELNINKATGEFKDANNISAVLNIDAGLGEIKNLSLRFLQGGENLGVANVLGTFDLNKKEADIKLNIEKIAGSVLTLVGAQYGMAINSDGLNSSLAVKVSKQGQLINANGKLNCDKLIISKAGLRTPAIDIKCQLDAQADLSNSNATVRAFEIGVNQSGKQVVSLNLSRELNFNWGRPEAEIGESVVNFNVSSLNLADWRSVIGPNIGSGIVNSKSVATVKNAGKSISFDLGADISNLNAQFASNVLQNGRIEIASSGNLDNFNKLRLAKANLDVGFNLKSAVKFSLSGDANIDNMSGNFDVSTELDLGQLIKFAPELPYIKIYSGVLNYNGKISQQFQQKATNVPIRTVSGVASLNGFSALIMSNNIPDCSFQSDLNIVQTGDNVAINQATVKINRANKSAGELTAKGTVDLKNMGGDLTLTVNDLNQEILKPLASQYLAGRDLKTISIDVALSASKSKDSKLSGTAKIKNLLVDDPQGIIPAKPIDVSSDINISLSEKGIADIKRLNVAFNQEGKVVGALDCAGTYNLSNNACRIKLNVKDINEEGLAPFLPPLNGIGTIKTISINGGIDANVDLKTDSTITGDLNINNLLIVGTNKIPVSQPLAILANLSTKINSKGLITVDSIAGNIKEGNNPAGSFTITASYNTNTGTATGNLKVNDLNQNLLKIYPMLAGKTLKQISINADLAGNYNPKANSSLSGGVKIGGVVVEDSKTKTTTQPIDLGFAVDSKMQKQTVDLNKFQITLTPTKLAENKINVSGKINLEKTNAIAGNINLTSDSIDLTPVFQIFSAAIPTEEAKTVPAPTTTQQPAPSTETEMPAITLPLSNFVFQASVKKCYLNALEIANILAAAKIDGGKVELNPFQLTLNNTPVNSNVKLNLGVPGYQYDISGTVNGLNLSPILTSFMPDLAATVNGVLYSDLAIKGAGTTGKSLKENLNGKFIMNLTNANIQVISSKTVKTILTPIVLILGIPEVLNSPIQSVSTSVMMGDGNIDLKNFTVYLPVLIVESAGKIPIADVLTNSPLDLPIEISLQKEFASKLSLQNIEGDYVKLPNFVQIKGTVGSPEVKIDKLKIAGITALGIGGSAKTQTGNIIRGVGNVLTGQSFTNKAGTTDNTPSTKTNTPIKKLFNIFKK